MEDVPSARAYYRAWVGRDGTVPAAFLASINRDLIALSFGGNSPKALPAALSAGCARASLHPTFALATVQP